jgi:homoserine kinase
MKSRCKNAGALGGGISGSGPSIFMLSEEEETAYKVEETMKEIYEKIGVDYKTYVTHINQDGVKIVE